MILCLRFLEGLKFQALEGLKSNAKADDSNFYDSLFTFFRRVEIKKTNKRKADDSNFGN